MRASLQSYFLWRAGEPRLISDSSSMSSWIRIQCWNISMQAAVVRTSSSVPPKALHALTHISALIPLAGLAG